MRGKNTVATRLERYITRGENPDDCWVWTGHKTADERGAIGCWRRDKYGVVGAHIVSYELHKGPVPPGKSVLERCGRKGCINPEHLYLGSRRVGRRRRFTPDQEQKIKELYKAGGATHRSLATRFECAPSIITAIINNR